eukprot:Skav217565  [mRNA]  locus=scaffold1602:634505:646721:+ [translate_table: standard]
MFARIVSIVDELLAGDPQCTANLLPKMGSQLKLTTATPVRYGQTDSQIHQVLWNRKAHFVRAWPEDTIAKYVPFYTNAVVQVKDALDQSKLLLKTFGPEETTDLLQKIDDVNATVTAKFSDLARSAGHIADDVSTVAVKASPKSQSRSFQEKLNYISSTTASLNEQFTEKLDAFTGSDPLVG